MTAYTRDDIAEALDDHRTVAVVLGWTDTAWSPTRGGEFTGPGIITYTASDRSAIVVAGEDYPEPDPDSEAYADVVRALTEDADLVLP